MLGDNTSGLTALSHDKKRCCCGGNQSTGQQRRLLCGKPDCWLAAGFPGQQLDLQSGSGGCCAGNGLAVSQRRFLGSKLDLLSGSGGCCAGNSLAVSQRRFLDSNRIYCLAAAVAAQETVWPYRSGGCWTATGFAVKQRRLLYRKRFRCPAAAFPNSNSICCLAIRVIRAIHG